MMMTSKTRQPLPKNEADACSLLKIDVSPARFVDMFFQKRTLLQSALC